MSVMKTVAQSYYDCAFAICKNNNTDESKSDIGYFSLDEIPDEIDVKKHPKIAQRIREAEEAISKVKCNKPKTGELKSKITKVSAQSKKRVEKRSERTRDESR